MNIKHKNNMIKINLFSNVFFIFIQMTQCNQMPEYIYSVVLHLFK